MKGVAVTGMAVTGMAGTGMAGTVTVHVPMAENAVDDTVDAQVDRRQISHGKKQMAFRWPRPSPTASHAIPSELVANQLIDGCSPSYVPVMSNLTVRTRLNFGCGRRLCPAGTSFH